MIRTPVSYPKCFGYLDDDTICDKCAMNFSCGVRQIELEYNMDIDGNSLDNPESEDPTPTELCPYGHTMKFINSGHKNLCKDYDTVVWNYNRYHCKKCNTHYYITSEK